MQRRWRVEVADKQTNERSEQTFLAADEDDLRRQLLKAELHLMQIVESAPLVEGGISPVLPERTSHAELRAFKALDTLLLVGLMAAFAGGILTILAILRSVADEVPLGSTLAVVLTASASIAVSIALFLIPLAVAARSICVCIRCNGHAERE
ncbi:MAG: hypothetical protein ACF8R9_09530 [Phycisphaerales bacterium JB054]